MIKLIIIFRFSDKFIERFSDKFKINQILILKIAEDKKKITSLFQS